jgi:hypothetical protein
MEIFNKSGITRVWRPTEGPRIPVLDSLDSIETRALSLRQQQMSSRRNRFVIDPPSVPHTRGQVRPAYTVQYPRSGFFHRYTPRDLPEAQLPNIRPMLNGSATQ